MGIVRIVSQSVALNIHFHSLLHFPPKQGHLGVSNWCLKQLKPLVLNSAFLMQNKSKQMQENK